ncbi:TPA: hypothetical protein PJH80_005820 [Raoultella ornithinolytica]|nr:hypothetical protein [Raoultella ornithinolytica]HDH7839052.1 hypothetical protein [Raoultella ornithinolytica]
MIKINGMKGKINKQTFLIGLQEIVKKNTIESIIAYEGVLESARIGMKKQIAIIIYARYFDMRPVLFFKYPTHENSVMKHEKAINPG